MPTIGDIVERLEQFAPTALAEDWDNVGLLVGDISWPARRVMTCLTVTPTTVHEALQRKADLIVTHHPLPFRALKSITTETTAGKLLLNLIAAQIGVYSPHTAFDSAPTGINQHLAIGLGLREIVALVRAPGSTEPDVGAGRMGILAEEYSLQEMARRVKNFLGIDSLHIVGDDQLQISRVAIACGSGGSFLPAAIAEECDCLVTGETNLHTCLEAEARSLGLILTGHFASERFALLSLAEYLSEQVSGLETWTSTTESDPLRAV
ncbi:MAG: Nif3-like dinuclear metal center hexameric protein [Pirellulales bacterium]|nr:Nif3-like dinuclear metal center hexameric protein [Pirellulales bacterium]